MKGIQRQWDSIIQVIANKSRCRWLFLGDTSGGSVDSQRFKSQSPTQNVGNETDKS
jgi:hypothetical protein